MRLPRFFLNLLVAWLAFGPALAAAPAVSLLTAPPPAAAFGPGSAGYLPTCSSTVTVGPTLYQSNSFSTSPWVMSHTGGSAPTVATNSAIVDPFGGHNAWTLSLGALTVTSGNWEELANATSLQTNYPNTFDIYVQAPPQNVGQVIALSETSNGTTYDARSYLTLTGKWQRAVLTVSPPSGGTRYLVIGFDLRDSNQLAKYTALYGAGGTIPAINLNIAFSQAVIGKVELPYTPTTTTNANAQSIVWNHTVAVAAKCPPGVAFRDFTKGGFGGFTLLQGNSGWCCGPASSSALGYGGIGPAMISGAQNLVGGQWAGLANGIVGAHTTNLWGQTLNTAPDLMANWTWQQAVAAPAVTTPLTAYILHSAMLSNGCTYSGTFYSLCFLFSGTTSTAITNSSISLAYGNSLTSLNISAAAVINNAELTASGLGSFYSGVTNPSLPGCTTINGVYWCMTSTNDNGSLVTVFFTSTPTTDMSGATPWTVYDVAIRPYLASDWDNGYDYLDDYLYVNPHGFLEGFYTAFGGSRQYVGYFVAPLVTDGAGNVAPGPIYKQNGCAIGSNNPGCVHYACAPTATTCTGTPTQPLWGGSPYIGDDWMMTQRGLLMVGGNFDDGSANSKAYIQVMPNK